MTNFRHIAFGLAVFSLPFLVHCTKRGGSGVSTHLTVKAMKTKGSSRSNSSAQTRTSSVADKIVPSKTHFSYAVVDGVKFHLTKIIGEDAKSDNPLTTVTLSKDLTLTGDPSQAVAMDETVSWEPGDYRGISVHLTNTWDVKAYCWTMKSGGNSTGYLVYTTASGVQVKDCSSGGVDCTVLPDTYDYYHYSTLNTYSGYVSSNDYQQETHLNFSVAATDSPILSLLYDGSYGVTCWDGQAAYDTSTAFGGFAGMTDSTHTTYFGATTPVFTTWYLPLFAYVTTDASEAAPTARTFLASWAQPATGSDLDTTSGSFTFKPLSVVTMMYNTAGNIVAGSTRNYQGNGGDNPLDLDLEGFTASSSSGTDFYGSGWYWAGGSTAPIFVRNKKIVGFNPPGTPALFSTAYQDGPDCGKSMIDFQGNNASRACASSSTAWWLEMTR